MHIAKKFLTAIPIFLAVSVAATYGQQVSGRVVSLNGAGIGGVNIVLMGTPLGTATDMSGGFTISLPEGNDVLIFSLLRHKTVEQPLFIRKGHQYHVTVFLSRKAQTFSKSDVLVDELPLDCAVIWGTVTDQSHRALAGVNVRQERSSFSAVTDMNGHFRLPVPDGGNSLVVSLPGFKSLDFAIDVGKTDISVDITLVQDNIKKPKAKSVAEVSPAR